MPTNTKGLDTKGSDLKEQAAVVAQDLKELGHLTTKAARDRISQAGDVATDLYQQGLDRAGEVYNQGRRKARELGTRVENQVKQRPFQTMLVVAGAAAVLGYLLSRRQSR